MESRFEDFFPLAISEYLSKPDVDYALMLNGDWGSGKTFYCTQILPEKLKTNEKHYKVIDISLYGKRNTDTIMGEIAYKLLLLDSKKEKNDKAQIIGGILQDNLPIVLDSLSNNTAKTSAVIAMNAIKKYSTKVVSKLKGINIKQNVLIVFDDLERCDSDYLFNLLGQINSAFIEQNYHVLFVTNENELAKKDEFLKKKEKLIRTTFSFSESLITTLKEIVNHRDKVSASFLLFQKYSTEIEKMIERHIGTIKNFRTWIYSFDVFDYVVKRASIESSPYLVHLFMIIIITVHFKTTNPTIFTDTIDIDGKTDEPSLKKQLRDSFKLEFSFFEYGREWRLDTYKGELEFHRIKSIEKYIDSGFFDVDLFKNDFDEIFPIGTEYESAYVNLHRYALLDDKSLLSSLKTVLEGVDKDKYSVRFLRNIGILLDSLVSDGYFSFIKERISYKRRIGKSLRRKLEIEKGRIWQEIDDRLSGFMNSKDFIASFPLFLQSIVSEVVIKDRRKYQKELFASFLSNLGQYELISIPDKNRRRMAASIVKYDLLEYFLSFNFKDIFTFSLYLDSISRSSNCGSVPDYYSEVKPLKIIKSYLATACERNHYSGKIKCDMERLMKNIEDTCHKLENTHKGEN